MVRDPRARGEEPRRTLRLGTGGDLLITTTYDPEHPAYRDSADVRAERDRVFDLCHGCRLCWNLCPSFGTLLRAIDEHHDGDVAALTDAEHDLVVDQCYQCKLCLLKCPYVPPHEWQLDFPRLMLRSVAARGRKARGFGRLMASTDRLGRMATRVAPLANAMLRNRAARALMERTAGVARHRALRPYARTRFSTWFRRHKTPAPQEISLFPTCLVEYQAPAIGKDFVRVCERNRVGVALPEGTVCCGMPWLDLGDVERFLEAARRNVAVLEREVAAGRDIVVLQPTCGYVLKKEYPQYLGTEAARAVAARTLDASEYLMRLHAEGRLAVDFPGAQHETITWHRPCHLRAQATGYKGRDLMALTGARVSVVDGCSGIDGMWGYRVENVEMARAVAAPLAKAIEKAGGAVVAGDCHLANGAIEEETGRRPLHPVQIIARAYGIPEA
ncbi:MAG: 4Fe-4S dicluster domain-containing protein [Acidobacteria bacterium]|nr:4Fe-4S dicluster domain-containing protein [Acidobacteriota bacterium]